MSLETKLKTQLFSSTALPIIFEMYPQLIPNQLEQSNNENISNRKERRKIRRGEESQKKRKYKNKSRQRNSQQIPYYIFNETVEDGEGNYKNVLYFTNPHCDYEIYFEYYIPELEPPIEGFETLEECIADISKDIKKLGLNTIYTGNLPTNNTSNNNNQLRFFNIFSYYDGRDEPNCGVELYRKPVNPYIIGEFKKYGIKVIHCGELPDANSTNKDYLH